MGESENSESRQLMGVDGKGRLLTEEGRAARAEELNALLGRAKTLRAELATVMEKIAQVSSTPISEGGHSTSELAQKAHEIRVELEEVMDEIGLTSSSYYPAIPIETPSRLENQEEPDVEEEPLQN